MTLDSIISLIALPATLAVLIPLVFEVDAQTAAWPRRQRLLVVAAEFATLPPMLAAIGLYA